MYFEITGVMTLFTDGVRHREVSLPHDRMFLGEALRAMKPVFGERFCQMTVNPQEELLRNSVDYFVDDEVANYHTQLTDGCHVRIAKRFGA